MKMIKNLFKDDKTILIILYSLFAGLLVCANTIAAKQIIIGHWFGQDVAITVGIVCYPFTFLITDIIGERWGKKAAQRAVIGGMVGQVVAILLTVLANVLPGNNPGTDASFNAILGSNWILTIGSLIACLLSQSWDVWIFHKLRDKYIEKHGSTKGGRWIWNNVGTITSQLIDSIVFYCFLILMLHTQGVALSFANCVATVFSYWIVKIVIALIDTPIFYLCTRVRSKEDGNEEE